MPEPGAWRHYRFGLLVTGKGERKFLVRLFRSLCDRAATSGICSCDFSIIAKVEQLSPRTLQRHVLAIPGKKQQKLPTRDEECALFALGFIKGRGDFVLLIDDLEGDRRANAAEVYTRYRSALDRVLPAEFRYRSAVHFLVNMLEAYYFAHARAINEVMDCNWDDFDGDVETIGHPKNDLKARLHGFDEIVHGERILERLDVPHILSHPDRCASLRTLFGWCWRAMGFRPGEGCQLEKGAYFEVTSGQIGNLPELA